jgi:predicted molibdopterin-dependent oxidoreductase YjgC
MFKRLSPLDPEKDPQAIQFAFEGQPLYARQGDTVAAALLASGVVNFRTTPVSHAPRAPWCMMGICFECLVEIDGIPNCQACQVIVEPDMRVARQLGARRIDL